MREWCKGSHRRLKISRLRACGFDSRLSHQIWADSLMVKQGTHNALSESSILSQPTINDQHRLEVVPLFVFVVRILEIIHHHTVDIFVVGHMQPTSYKT